MFRKLRGLEITVGFAPFAWCISGWWDHDADMIFGKLGPFSICLYLPGCHSNDDWYKGPKE